MDTLLIKEYKKNNRHAGKYLINKVCEEYEIAEYQLFESTSRKELTDARTVYCAVAYKVFDLTQQQISKGFGSHRNLVYRAVKEIEEAVSQPNPTPYQKELLKKYNRVLFRMNAYLTFKAKGVQDVDNETDRKT